MASDSLAEVVDSGDSSIDQISDRLKQEIASTTPDVESIRRLLLMGATPDPKERSKMWRILLLGSPESLPRADDLWRSGHKALGSLSSNEEHVLSMDVPRTRGDIPFFKEKDTQTSIQNLLTRWCLSHGTRYRQGLNEVLAPFYALEEADDQGNSVRIDERERYSLFDAFVCKYLAAFYIDGNADITASKNGTVAGNSPLSAFSPEKQASVSLSSTIASKLAGTKLSETKATTAVVPPHIPATTTASGKEVGDTTSPSSSSSGGLRAHTSADMGIPLALRLLDLTIRFHDPQLSRHLEDGFIGPELYAVPWLGTALARSAPLEVCWQLWDILIAIDDPCLLPLLCIELLRSERENILRREPQDVLEVISTLGLNSVELVDKIRVNALETYALTPRGLRRPLRSICCYINIGDEGGGDYSEDDFFDDGEFDYIAEEVEEVAAAVVAAARMPMNKAVDMLSKLDDAFSAAFSPQPTIEGDKEGEQGAVQEPNNEEEEEEEEEEEISLSMSHKIASTVDTTPKKTAISKGDKKSGLLSQIGLSSPLKSQVKTPAKTPVKRNSSGSFSALLSRKSQQGSSADLDEESFQSPPPKVKTRLVRQSSSNQLAHGVAASSASTMNHQIQAWSPRRISELCNAGIFTLSPKELVGSLLSKKRVKKETEYQSQGKVAGEANEVLSSFKNDGLLPWLVLDIRPKENSSETRALATSLQLPLEVMTTKKALEIWLQHFDSVKGAPVCILDSNFHMNQNKSLWKKLGLGGSGGAVGGSTGGVGKLTSDTSTVRSEGGAGGLFSVSPQGKWLAEVLVNELGFPLVAVFGGSFTDLVEEVQKQQGGQLEPLIIDLAAGSVVGKGPISPVPTTSRSGGNNGKNKAAEFQHDPNSLHIGMSEAEQRKLLGALEEAEVRGHETVAKLLRKRLEGYPSLKAPKQASSLSTSSASSKNESGGSSDNGNTKPTVAKSTSRVVVGALPRPLRSDKEQNTQDIAQERGHSAVVSKLRETTTTPRKTSRSNSMQEKMRVSSGGGSGWVEVEDADAAGANYHVSSPGSSSHVKTISNTFGAVRSLVNRADEWVEKHMESLLEDTPTKPRNGDKSSYGGGYQEEEGDEWTEVDDSVSMDADVAETLKAIQAAINPQKK